MPFTFVVLQLDGAVGPLCRRAYAAVEACACGRLRTRGFGRMLRQCLPAAGCGSGGFAVELKGPGRVGLDWQQDDPFSAQATFHAADRPAFIGLLLSGCEAGSDAAAVRASEELLAAWRPLPDRGACPEFGLRALRQRPLLAVIPWPVPLADERLLTQLLIDAQCLAVAFFRRAEAASADNMQRHRSAPGRHGLGRASRACCQHPGHAG